MMQSFHKALLWVGGALTFWGIELQPAYSQEKDQKNSSSTVEPFPVVAEGLVHSAIKPLYFSPYVFAQFPHFSMKILGDRVAKRKVHVLRLKMRTRLHYREDPQQYRVVQFQGKTVDLEWVEPRLADSQKPMTP